jgi:hypothetical protein
VLGIVLYKSSQQNYKLEPASAMSFVWLAECLFHSDWCRYSNVQGLFLASSLIAVVIYKQGIFILFPKVPRIHHYRALDARENSSKNTLKNINNKTLNLKYLHGF